MSVVRALGQRFNIHNLLLEDIVNSRQRPKIEITQDHVIQIREYVKSSRDLVSGIFDTYMSLVGNRLNSIMKVLTLIAAISIFLTFIAGIYGMNFENMPELSWRWGYFAALSAMGVCGVVMMVYFKIKKWF